MNSDEKSREALYRASVAHFEGGVSALSGHERTSHHCLGGPPRGGISLCNPARCVLAPKKVVAAVALRIDRW